MSLRRVLLLLVARRALELLESTITRQCTKAATVVIDVEARLHLAEAMIVLTKFVAVHGGVQLDIIVFIC